MVPSLSLLAIWQAMTTLILAGLLMPGLATAQQVRFGDANMRVELVADGPPAPGQDWMVALHFTPRSSEWHGYWSNPGDAGEGLALDWALPAGWSVGEAQYPVPQTLVIGGLMNHVYEGEHTVLVPLHVPSDAVISTPVSVYAQFLACTDKQCVPQDQVLTLDPARASRDPRFDGWRSAIAPVLDQPARFAISNATLRLAIPLPASLPLDNPHLFMATGQLGKGMRPDYAGRQSFLRKGDLLVAEIPLRTIAREDAAMPASVDGILSFGDGMGVRFAAQAGNVATGGMAPVETRSAAAMPALWILLLGALAGGLILNVMPCVFPILSLKALSLTKAGTGEQTARRDALAYTAGTVLACMALGAAVLALRAAGEQVGWAFQLQEPRVVVALLLLAVAITANFLGLFEVPGLAIAGGKGSSRGSFATGLLAAFVATPCTGPFMAAALGAALVIPPVEGMLVFAALGLGLALPFLAVGFSPALRRLLPRPGPWMGRFRRWMALPMGLTALALVWLVWRIGGANFLFIAVLLAVVMLIWLFLAGRMQQQRSPRASMVLGAALLGCGIALAVLPQPRAGAAPAAESMLSPEPFSESALAEARASGRPVFVWFTADWCLTCKVNEQVAIERAATRDALAGANAIVLRGDWTNRDDAIARFLAQQGAAGVPLYLWYEPGREAETLPQVLAPDTLVSLASRQRGQVK